MIFVFGSNEAGIHGAGAAKYAHKSLRFPWGVGVGEQGKAYAIPTKDKTIQTLPIPKIGDYVEQFIEFAQQNPLKQFKVTCIGCGLAGLQHSQIAPMFMDAPDNCYFDTLWKEYLTPEHKFWGTF